MRLKRLCVSHFAGIASMDVEFGPGLNVLYGPNELGKSTLADAIRLALLLPYSSSHAEDFHPWVGGQRPQVELTFETEAQRVWRVKKQFGKSGFATLEESRDGIDFWEIEKARKVDARIRELLKWGIPEPGGSGTAKGLPESFLATVLLSTQADVAAVLHQSLEEDPTGSGKERIAAALEAVAQDPLFLALLHQTQEMRDLAYTPTGNRKGGKGSPFREAADRVRALQEEKERLQREVDESEGVEAELRDLAYKRTTAEAGAAGESDRLILLERMARETANLREADEHLREAVARVTRIEQLDNDVGAAEGVIGRLAEERAQAEESSRSSQHQLSEANTSLEANRRTLETLRGDVPSATTVEQQSLELRRSRAEGAVVEAEARLVAIDVTLTRQDSATRAEAEHRRLIEGLARSQADLNAATDKERRSDDEQQHLDRLECALALSNAQAQLESANANVAQQKSLRARATALSAECEKLESRHAGMHLPAADVVASMRRLETELAAARGAMNVGLVATVTPVGPRDVYITRDGAESRSTIENAIEVDAGAELQIELPGMVTVRVLGGRAEAREKARTLEERWTSEAKPVLDAAVAQNLAELDAKFEEGRAIENELTVKKAQLAAWEEQLRESQRAIDVQREAEERVKGCREALADAPLDSLIAELATLSGDPASTLRNKKQSSGAALAAAQREAAQARTEHGVTEERLRQAAASLESSRAARDAALAQFAEGIEDARKEATAARDEANADRNRVADEFSNLAQRVENERHRAQAAVDAAELVAVNANEAAAAAQKSLADAIAANAKQVGRLEQLRVERANADLELAAASLRDATDRRTALPVPERAVTAEEITASRASAARAQAVLTAVQGEIHRAHGALEQVGGGVAREKLREISEAYDLALRYEREVEAEYEAWDLLLEEMKAANEEQASNLGQVLGPAVADRFESLTNQRYQGVRIQADLKTEGVVLHGAVRPINRMSVGTREQLSTLYRLALAEYLGSTVVLDDQLVQSDNTRMDWFRALLTEKARAFQVLVFTCRPGDYVCADVAMPAGNDISRDSSDGYVRVIALARAVQAR